VRVGRQKLKWAEGRHEADGVDNVVDNVEFGRISDTRVT
jgi:hypothetical protein